MEGVRRLQFDFDSAALKDIDHIKTVCGFATYRELINNALTLLEWVLTQRMRGFAVAAIDESRSRTIELQMPGIERAAKVANDSQGKVQYAVAGQKAL